MPPEENPEDDPATAQALAEGHGVLKQRAIQAADESLHFTDAEMQAVQALADQFYHGIWHHEDGELSLSVNWNKSLPPGQCISLRITRNDDQVLVRPHFMLSASTKDEGRGPFSESFPVLKPDFSRQYSLFPDSES